MKNKKEIESGLNAFYSESVEVERGCWCCFFAYRSSNAGQLCCGVAEEEEYPCAQTEFRYGCYSFRAEA